MPGGQAWGGDGLRPVRLGAMLLSKATKRHLQTQLCVGKGGPWQVPGMGKKW